MQTHLLHPCPLARHLVRHFTDGATDMAFVSEAQADLASKRIDGVNDRFEHLTCFVGGMLVLGKWRGGLDDHRSVCLPHACVPWVARMGGPLHSRLSS